MLKSHLIFHPTDSSTSLAAAFSLACSLARDQGARLLVMHVEPPPAVDGEVLARRQEDGAFWRELSDQLHDIKPTDPSIEVEYRLDEGAPASVIADTAATRGCDLILMGTHGRTGLGRSLMGSVAEHVLRKATTPVLTATAPPEPTFNKADTSELLVAAGR